MDAIALVKGAKNALAIARVSVAVLGVVDTVAGGSFESIAVDGPTDRESGADDIDEVVAPVSNWCAAVADGVATTVADAKGGILVASILETRDEGDRNTDAY